MRVRGIHYDIGTTTLEGASTRPILEADSIDRELADIARALNASAVRITGGDLDRMAAAGRAAVGLGLEAWLSPMLPNADPPTTLGAIERTAAIGEALRQAGGTVVLVVGCELSAFMSGLIPGDDQAARLQLLTDLPRLLAEVSARGLDPQRAFDDFLGEAVARVRASFGGQVTYASGAWEHLDWSRFDLAGIDAYRDATNRDRFSELLEESHGGLSTVVTEAGCSTFAGAADLGSLGWTALDRTTEPRRLKDGVVRDEAGQAAELGAVLDLVERSAVEGVFVYTYIAPSYPSSREPAFDLDAASYALVRSWPDGTTERKAAFGVVADRFASSTD